MLIMMTEQMFLKVTAPPLPQCQEACGEDERCVGCCSALAATLSHDEILELLTCVNSCEDEVCIVKCQPSNLPEECKENP
jgi:hypothetical protein